MSSETKFSVRVPPLYYSSSSEMTCIPEQRYRQRWLRRVFLPITGAALLLFYIKLCSELPLRSNIQPNDHDTKVLEEKRAHTGGVKNDSTASLNHGSDDTAHDQSINEELHKNSNAAPVCDVKEPAVPEENGGVKEESEKLSQNDERKKEEQIYAERQMKIENYFSVHTAAGSVQFMLAVVCLVISYVVLLCVEKLCLSCRKYGLATVAIVLAMSAFSQFFMANKNFNEQGATAKELREEIKHMNWEIGNAITSLGEKDRLIENMSKEIQTLSISLNERILDNIKRREQDEMHKNHTKMLEERCTERIKNETRRKSSIMKQYISRSVETKNTSVQRINELKMKDETQQNEIANLTKRFKEHQQMMESQQETIESKDNQISGLNNQISGLNNQISSLKNQISGLNNQISGLNNQISGLNNQISGLNNQISGLKNQIYSNGQQYSNRQQVEECNRERNRLEAHCTIWQLTMYYMPNTNILVVLAVILCCICCGCCANTRSNS